MTDQDERTAMSVQEIALLREIARWRRTHGWTYFQWRRGVGFGRFTEWKAHRDDDGQSNVAYEPPGFGRPRLLFSRNYYREEVRELPVRTVAEAVDVLVALGFLPPRFCSAYRAGWHAAEVWHGTWINDEYQQDAEFTHLFHDPDNISCPALDPTAGQHETTPAPAIGETTW